MPKGYRKMGLQSSSSSEESSNVNENNNSKSSKSSTTIHIDVPEGFKKENENKSITSEETESVDFPGKDPKTDVETPIKGKKDENCDWPYDDADETKDTESKNLKRKLGGKEPRNPPAAKKPKQNDERTSVTDSSDSQSSTDTEDSDSEESQAQMSLREQQRNDNQLLNVNQMLAEFDATYENPKQDEIVLLPQDFERELVDDKVKEISDKNEKLNWKQFGFDESQIDPKIAKDQIHGICNTEFAKLNAAFLKIDQKLKAIIKQNDHLLRQNKKTKITDCLKKIFKNTKEPIKNGLLQEQNLWI